MYSVVCSWLFLVCYVLSSKMTFARKSESNCETLPSTIHLSKEVFTSNGRLERTCEGDMAVNHCEGTCYSQLQPSVTTSSGFLKECHCCQEGYLRERRLTLPRCFDSDGMTLTGELGTLDVVLNEPTDCRCTRCEDNH